MNFLKLLYQQYPLLSLGIFSSIIFLAHLDVLPVTIMEARNFITAREMLTHSNWIFTTLNNIPRYEKPPLPTWLTAISASLFGINSLFALRLPAAILAILLIIFSYKSALKMGASKLVSFFTGLTLATSFYVVFSGRSGQWDIFTHSFMMLAIYCLLKVFTKPTGQKWWWTLLGGVMFGFSFLSKGPVSLYTLFLPFIFSYFTVFRMENLKTQILKLIIFLITGIILGTWWSVVVRYFDSPALLAATDVESSRWFNYSVKPFYYYWSFFTQSGIWTVPALLGLAYWYLKDRVSNFKVYQFYFFWTIGSLILLSIIPEKKSRYLLPVLIPLAATTAFYLEFLLKNFHPSWKKKEKLPILIYFALLEIVCLAAPLIVFLALKMISGSIHFGF